MNQKALEEELLSLQFLLPRAETLQAREALRQEIAEVKAKLSK